MSAFSTHNCRAIALLVPGIGMGYRATCLTCGWYGPIHFPKTGGNPYALAGRDVSSHLAGPNKEPLWMAQVNHKDTPFVEEPSWPASHGR